MIYRTVFDIAQNGHAGWGRALDGLVPIAFGALMLIVDLRTRKTAPSDSRWKVALGAICVGILFSLWTLWTSHVGQQSAASYLQEGRYQTVEGVVQDFEAGGSPGKYFENFSVAAHQFGYYGSDMSGYGFHLLARQGGPIKDGLHVRIAYSGRSILRLEIAP
ncbi:MAG TPA: hypothetical protein VHZ32_00725 [Rhizomicrobium sp.]|jgi:hypothetical protein|nr:hypothetical protein [Rhizomicrobium sp.]